MILSLFKTVKFNPVIYISDPDNHNYQKIEVLKRMKIKGFLTHISCLQLIIKSKILMTEYLTMPTLFQG
ncbi:hypothetical protein ASE55_12210 [Chryseobacterium sp. Leaf201]|nr:hypothetical protein ASE55_12210 [Chryseobacterium sp. Leaf201]